MTLAATAPKTRRPTLAGRPRLSAWQVLTVVLTALLGFLVVTPDGIAEPMQDVAGWLVIGGVATLAVAAVVTVLDRLLDCEGN